MNVIKKYWFLIVLTFVGCAGELYLIRKPVKENFVIEGIEFDEAFSKAIRAVTDIGLSGIESDKNAGTFNASSYGLGVTTSMNFFLQKEEKGLSFVVQVKSSRGGKKIIADFLNAFGKYAKIRAGGHK